jgi:hypothetical protein
MFDGITAAPLKTDSEWKKTLIQLNRYLNTVDRKTETTAPERRSRSGDS